MIHRFRGILFLYLFVVVFVDYVFSPFLQYRFNIFGQIRFEM